MVIFIVMATLKLELRFLTDYMNKVLGLIIFMYVLSVHQREPVYLQVVTIIERELWILGWA